MNYNNTDTDKMLEKLINLKQEFNKDNDSEKLFKSIFVIIAENKHQNSKLKKYVKQIEMELNMFKKKIKNLENKK
mgnify:FL=1